MAPHGTSMPIEGNFKAAVKTVVTAWLLAGTLDITAAGVYYPLTYKITPIDLLKGIASGIFGKKAFTGGIQMALFGLVTHYLIALIWTTFFFLIFPRIKILSINRFITGMIYGIFVWLIMNLIIIPLSNAVHLPLSVPHALVGVVFLMFCMGLPVSMIVGKHYSKM